MPGKKIEEDILLVLRHIEMLDHKARFDKRLGESGREKRLLERTYLMHQEPYAWRNHAKMLRRAANAVLDLYKQEFRWPGATEPHFMFFDIDSAYMYLIGMAIENLIKGIYVARCPKLINLKKEPIGKKGVKGYKLHYQLDTHDVSALARTLKKRYGVNFTDDEFSLIELFERFITWTGRYRIPKDSVTFVDERFSTYYYPDGEPRPFSQGTVDTVATSYNELYSKLYDILSNDVENWHKIGERLESRKYAK